MSLARPQSVDGDHSILNDLGQEVTGIVAPVSLCMVITIFLVRMLHGGDDVNRGSVIIATAGYDEQVCSLKYFSFVSGKTPWILPSPIQS